MYIDDVGTELMNREVKSCKPKTRRLEKHLKFAEM